MSPSSRVPLVGIPDAVRQTLAARAKALCAMDPQAKHETFVLRMLLQAWCEGVASVKGLGEQATVRPPAPRGRLPSLCEDSSSVSNSTKRSR